jgi:hypothetical protein
LKLNFRDGFSKTNYSDIKFHENPSFGSRVVPCGRTDGHDELIVAFGNFSNALKSQWHVFRLPPPCKWGLRSSAMLRRSFWYLVSNVSGLSIRPIFKETKGRPETSVSASLRDIPEDRRSRSWSNITIDKSHKWLQYRQNVIKLYRVFRNALTAAIPHSDRTRRPLCLPSSALQRTVQLQLCFTLIAWQSRTAASPLALHLVVTVNLNSLWEVKFPPDHEITILMTRDRRAINFQIYGYKTLFYSPLPLSTFFFFLIREVSLEEIVPSRQHLYCGNVTFILFILSKQTAGIVNSVVYVTIVFLSCRCGLQIFVRSGFTDFKVTVFYCRQCNSLRRLAVVWETLSSLGICRTLNFAAVFMQFVKETIGETQT